MIYDFLAYESIREEHLALDRSVDFWFEHFSFGVLVCFLGSGCLCSILLMTIVGIFNMTRNYSFIGSNIYM